MTSLLEIPDNFSQNPYAFYESLSYLPEPYFFSEYESMKEVHGVWLISSYDLCVQISKESQFISKSNNIVPDKSIIFDEIMLSSDGEKHKRLRGLISKHFSMRSIKDFTQIIEEKTKSYLEKFIPGSTVNFVDEIADVLPLEIIAEVIGFRKQHLLEIRKLSLMICDMFDSFVPGQYTKEDYQKALESFESIVTDEIAFIRANLNRAEDNHNLSICAGLVIDAQKNKLSEVELRAMFIFLMFAGHETTTNMLSSAMYLLLSHPTQLQELVLEPELINSCVEEVLRFESPEQRSTFRMTNKDLEFNGITIPANSQITLLLGSANRDKKMFNEPHRFDIHRKPNRHIAFGHGVHNCLGQHLSRLELNIFLKNLLPIFLQLQILGVPRWRKTSFFRGLETLTIEVKPGLSLDK